MEARPSVWPEERVRARVEQGGGTWRVSQAELLAEFAPRRLTPEGRRNVDGYLAKVGVECRPELSVAEPDDVVVVTLAAAPLAVSPPAKHVSEPSSPSLARRARRPASLVLAALGVLLLAEFAVTLLWREPVSALQAAGTQNDLDRRLEGLERRSAREGRARSRRPLRAQAADFRLKARDGSPVGRLWIPEIDLEQVVVAGTGPSGLAKGPGYYPNTPYPGEHGTVALAGHRTTYTAPFRHINDLKPGHAIRLHTPYGRFVYRVTSQQILDPSRAEVLRNAGYRRLVLTTCHPLFSQAQRLVVVAKQVLALPQQGS